MFAGSTYRVFARLAGNGLQAAWTPVKLVDVLRTVAPEVAAKIDDANRGALEAMSRERPNADGEKIRMILRALMTYGTALNESTGAGLSREELANAVAQGGLTAESFASVSSRRERFGAVAAFVQGKSGVEVDRVVAASLRAQALAEAGFSVDGGVPNPPAVGATPAVARESEERFLDSELVAIYW